MFFHVFIISCTKKLFKRSDIVIRPADFCRFPVQIFAKGAVVCNALHLFKISGKGCCNRIL